jgi:hypothetical protein
LLVTWVLMMYVPVLEGLVELVESEQWVGLDSG